MTIRLPNASKENLKGPGTEYIKTPKGYTLEDTGNKEKDIDSSQEKHNMTVDR